MAFWTNRRAAHRALAALVACAGALGAQAPKCELPMQAHPRLLTAGLQFNGVFKATAKPEEKVKALQAVVKTLTDDVLGMPAPMQPSRNFLLAQALLVWLDQPGTGLTEPRGKLGYTADPTGTMDITYALDSAFSSIRTSKPECSDSLKLYTNGLWGQLINKAVTFTNSQQLDSAEIYARRSMLFDKKQYYAYNIMANIALVKEDTASMIEWFGKTAEVTASATDTSSLKVRDNMLQNLASVFTSRASGATGAKKDSLTQMALATYKKYLGHYPNDLTTKLRMMRLSGVQLDSLAAARFVDTVLAGVNAVSDGQLTDAGSELTKNKLYSAGLRLFDAALKKNPFSRDGLYNSAVALNNLERFDEIRPYFQRLRELDPNNAGIYQLAKNVQASRKLAIQTAANKGVKPKAGQTIMLNPAQQAKIKVFNDSLVYYTQLIQNMNPTVDVRNFTMGETSAKFGAVLQVPPDKPAASYSIIVEFLNTTGAAVATRTHQTKQIAPGGFESISVEGEGKGITGFRYKVAK